MRNYTFLMLLFVCLFSSSIFAAGGDLGGGSQDGSADYPYLIEDFNDFQVFCNGSNYWASGVHIRLDCDLDLDPNLAGRIIYSQAPIAGDTDTDSCFDGTKYAGDFNGNGHVVSNLTIDGGSYSALFGRIESDGIVTNLGIENANITGSYSYISGLVGYNNGSIRNCYSTSVVTGNHYVSGLVGYNCGSITSCYSTGVVTGNYNVGGLVGYNCSSIISCYSMGTVIGNYYYVGGLVGYNDGSISNCYSTDAVTGNYYVGGLVGYINGSITSCYSTGAVTGDYYVGGLVGYDLYGSGNITSCFWDIQSSGMTIGVGHGSTTGVEGKTTVEIQTESTFTNAGWDFVDESANGTSQIWQMPQTGGCPELTAFTDYIPVELTGDGSQGNPYLINNVNDLGAVFHYNPSAYYKLTTDIDLSSIVWSIAVIPNFKGSFDGNNHTISNLTVDGEGYSALFGIIESDGIVFNLGIENANITGSYRHVSSLVSYNCGSISNCYSTSVVTGNYYFVGGLVGYNYGSITSCYSTGVVTRSKQFTGGLVGYNCGSISNCYSPCTVTGNYYVGGLVGYNNGSIRNCYSTGAVTGNYNVGGLVGWNYDGSISNCYSTGEINGGQWVGGLVGENFSIISNCYSTGVVTGDKDVGGLVGYNTNSIISCFWDVNTSGIADPEAGSADSDGMIGLETTQMKTQSTFTDLGWNLINCWGIGKRQTYPYLRKYSAVDFSNDGVVNFDDLAIFAENWLLGL